MRTAAAILAEQRQPLVIDEVETPALRYGQVLIRIHCARICGSQLGEIDGAKGPDRFLPHLLGHEAGATVMETGPEVRHVAPGDRVVAHWRPGAGIAARPAVFRWGSRQVNGGPITTFSEYSVVSENRLTRVPAKTDPEICALMADTITTGLGVVNNDAQVKIGESVVVFGAGGIGLGAILGARLAGAYPIVAVDVRENKLEAAGRVGASHCVLANGGDVGREVREILGGEADVVIDGTGKPEVLQTCFALTQAKGRCVGIGVMRFDQALELNTLPLHFGKILTGSEGGASQPHLDIPRYLRLIAAGRMDLGSFVSHRVKLAEVNEAIAAMRAGEVVHCLIKF